MRKEIIEIRKIMADDGYVFALPDKSIVFGTEMYLGKSDSEDNYIEITKEEGDLITQKQVHKQNEDALIEEIA